MLRIEPRDDVLDALRGVQIPCELDPVVIYDVQQRLGEGATCLVFSARRAAPAGRCPVVLKIARPSFVRQSPHASLVVRKEAVALGRLNERLPPTPFVVRLIDAGTLQVEQRGQVLELPWLVIEQVHGGAEGTTLTERVSMSMRTTGFAFEAARAAHAIECLTQALTAVHEVDVIHRDVKPDNVLCCGFGDDEIFKLADFGVARPAGLVGTFGGALFGTPGYAAPELQAEPHTIGPWTDVFGLAAAVFFLLTGQEYFPAPGPAQHVVQVASPQRRSILEPPGLSPELRAREHDCRAIDAELTRATALEPARRPPTAAALGAALLGCLPVRSRRGRVALGGRDTQLGGTKPLLAAACPATLVSAVESRVESLRASARSGSLDPWSWSIRQEPRPGRPIQSAAWDADGRCLAVTDAGLCFWDGTCWRAGGEGAHGSGAKVRFAHRTAPGRWIVGGQQLGLVIHSAQGSSETLESPDPAAVFHLCSGDVDDLAVLVGVKPAEPPMLCARVGDWWLRPLALREAALVTGIARVGPTCWLVVGEDDDGAGFACFYSPLGWQIERIEEPRVEPWTACAGQPDCRLGLAVGSRGKILWCERRGGPDGSAAPRERPTASLERIAEAPALSAAAVSAVGEGWAGGIGRLWRRDAGAGAAVASGGAAGGWARVWCDEQRTAPVVSILADAGLVMAVMADGAIVEGRVARASAAKP